MEEAKKVKFKISWGVSIFDTTKGGRPLKKVGEQHFKTEKDMAYWLYRNEK